MFIYIIQNKINLKRYVGKTVYPVNKRYLKHIQEAFNPKLAGHDTHFHRALRKYGVDNFEFEHIFDFSNNPNFTEEQLSIKEQEYILEYDTFIRSPTCKGYNMTLGGEGVSGLQAISIDAYNIDGTFVKTYPSIDAAAHDLDIHDTNIRACLNVNHVSKSIKGFMFAYHGEPAPVYELNQTRSVNMYNLNKQFIKQFDSLKSASEFVGCNIASILNCCTQKTLICDNKYIFTYAEDDVNLRREDNSRKIKIDVYNSYTREFIKTYDTMISLQKELKVSKTLVQRCLRSGNYLAGNYLICPHDPNKLRCI